MARKVIYTLVTLVLLFFAFIITGALASEFYEGEIVEEFPDRRIDVWRNLVSLEAIPARKPDVERVIILDDSIDGIVWREELSNG